MMFAFFGYTFSAYQMYFSPATASIHMYCATQSISVRLSWATYNGYTSYVPYVAGVTFSNHSVSASPFGPKNFIVGTCNQIGNCDTFYGWGNNGYFGGIQTGWTMVVQNSGYIRTATVSFTGIDPQANSKINSWASEYTYTNLWLTFGDLALSFFPAPCSGDNDNPTFGFTGWMTPHITNYTWPQFNDRIYIFDLRDMSGELDYGFFTWFNGDLWDADRTLWTDYSTWATVRNGSGIDLATFTMEIAVENSPDAWTFTMVTLTWTLNYTWWDAITGSVPGLVFYPYGFTWNRWNRNYTWYALTGELSTNTTYDGFDGWQLFGDQPEEEVIMTWYVYDRANPALKSNVFAVSFNQW